jgi:hypothetical protein
MSHRSGAGDRPRGLMGLQFLDERKGLMASGRRPNRRKIRFDICGLPSQPRRDSPR